MFWIKLYTDVCRRKMKRRRKRKNIYSEVSNRALTF